MTKADEVARSPCVSIWSISSCSSPSPRPAASRAARSASIWRWPRPARGSRAWRRRSASSLLRRGRRGVELTAAGESLLDHARIVLHNVETMRGDLAAFSPAASRPACICSPIRRGCRSICRRRWPPFSPSIRDITVDVEERESTEIARAIATGAADLGLAAEHALPDSIERIAVQRGPPGAGRHAPGRTGEPPAGRISARWWSAISSA